MVAVGGARTIKVRAVGENDLNKPMNAAGKSVGGFASGVHKASLVVLGAAAGIAAGLVAIGGEFDSAFDKIRITTGKTGKAAEDLEQSFRNVAKNVPASFDEISTAIAELNQRTDQTGVGLETLATAELNLSRITGQDLSSTIATTTRLFGDWGIKTKNQTAALDDLFRAGQATGIGVTKLSELLVQFGAPLRQLGFSFEESAALLGKWEKEGVNTELVLGGLKKALGTFAKAGKEPVKALQSLIKSLKDAKSTAEANKIAVAALGVKAGPDFAAAVREGRFGYEELLAVIKGGPDTINKAAAGTDDWAESLQLLKNKAFLALEPIAVSFFGWLSNTAVPALQSAFEWIENNQDAVKTWGKVLAGVAATIVTISAAIKAYEFALNAMKVASLVATAVTWALDAALWAQVAALLANPITWIVLGIIATIAAIVVLIAYWDEISAALQGLGRWFVEVFWRQWLKPVFIAWQEWMASVVRWFVDLKNKIVATFVDMGRAIASPFISAFNRIADAWNSTVGRLSWTIPDWVPGIGGANISAPKLPHFAAGGLARGNEPAVVGEDGPEIFFPGRTGRVASNDESKALVGAGSGDIYLNVQLDALSGAIKAERVAANRRTARYVKATRVRAAA